MIQVLRNKIFNFFESVNFGVIMAPEEGTFKFSLQSIEIVVTQGKSSPSHFSINPSTGPMKKEEFKEEDHAWLHSFSRW